MSIESYENRFKQCTGDDSCPLPGHWTDQGRSGPHRDGGFQSPSQKDLDWSEWEKQTGADRVPLRSEVCVCGRRPGWRKDGNFRRHRVDANNPISAYCSNGGPSETGPMTGGWNRRTGPLITALQELRDEVNRSMDEVQVGGEPTDALARAWNRVQEVLAS